MNPPGRQTLPAGGPARELLREKGQFWTPDWLADAMVAYVLKDGGRRIFDPAVGAGAFFRAGRRIGERLGREIQLHGVEVDSSALDEAARLGVSSDVLARVEIRDFVLDPLEYTYPAIVGNPPYIRHHRIPLETKERLKRFSKGLLGAPLDGRAGLHAYFLLQALQRLDRGGRLAFVVPADIAEGKYAPLLWRWIAEHYRIEHVMTFAPETAPFPNVDTNALVLMIRNVRPSDTIRWMRWFRLDPESLLRYVLSGFAERPDADAAYIVSRGLAEALAMGLSRPPNDGVSSSAVLGDFATVMRGVATGANEYFFLTGDRVTKLALPEEYVVPAIGRTRDVDGDELTMARLESLDRRGRPTRLLALDARPVGAFPESIQQYLRQGEQLGLPLRALISQRRPWYKMEVRRVPPILFAYLGRRSARFIRNRACVIPLTGFLCVYPRCDDQVFVDQLWTVLKDPRTVANLTLVGKSYGSGAIKVEPRALEKLPLDADLLKSAGLAKSNRIEQPRLFA